ncbi:MAG: universal stress protein [Verrucomicrobia bacterium]|nr:universal stress protein [Verrucomicrobiota bacterium]
MSKMKIVCGTDFSQNAIRATTAAARIAAKLKEPLVLVHVMELPAAELVGREFIEDAKGKGQARLKEEADRLRKMGVKVEERFAVGSPYETLTEVARASRAGMIIVASTKRSAPERWFVGSVAERVAQSSPVPTVVVRDAAVLESWVDGSRLLKLFVAADLGYSSDAALLWGRDLQKVGRCSITVAYVNWTPETHARIGMHGPVSLLENADEVQAILERDLRAKVEKLLGTNGVKVSVEPSWGRTDTYLVEMAQREKADLMVVGAHQRSGIRNLFTASVSRGAMNLAPMNVAVVPAKVINAVEAPLSQAKRVLVSTDFSEFGNGAIPSAYSILPRGGKVCLVHVIAPFELPNPLIAQYQPTHKNKRQYKAKVEKLKEALRALVPREAESLGIETEIEIAESRHPAEAICQAAARFGADVICIASHGRSGLSKVLFGSVAGAVIAKCDRPLLIVRPAKD